MSNLSQTKILAAVSAEDFIGRKREIEAILTHAKGEKAQRGLLLSGAPALGTSELLRQAYDRLFREQGETIPFYFALRKSDKTAKNAALRFLHAFLQQTVAFRRQETRILDAAPEISELAELAIPSDGSWIDRLIAGSENESELSDDRSFTQSCLSAPLRAAAHDAKSFVIVDNLHEAAYFSDEINFIEELKEAFSRADIPFVFAGRRRFLFGAMQAGGTKFENFETLELETLDFTEAGLLTERLAEKFALKINDQTRDLIGVQLGGNPAFTRLIFQGASEKNTNPDSFHRVEQVYADAIFGGRIGKFYDRIFEQIAPDVETQKSIVRLLYDAFAVENEKTPLEVWEKRVELSEEDFHRAAQLLNAHEIINLTSSMIETAEENQILEDYVTARFRLEIGGESRALVFGEMLSEFVKRAPQMMTRFYRRKSAIGLREILSVFDCQELPLALLDYGRFKEKLKGLSSEEIIKTPESDAEKIRLPQVVFSAHTVSFYPPIEKVTEKERSAVALGFDECSYTEEDETVWIAAEIDSKLEAAQDLTEFWCDRLEMVALMCNFPNYKLWLVAPEGFSTEALEVLQSRGGFGSSRRQVEMLVDFLNAKDAIKEKTNTNEFEMIVPMGDDTELIAAQAVEEIAKRHHFTPKAINQIKTALVEACINATEHSHSPDRRIYQKFAIEDDKIVITISNRGLRLRDKKAEEITPDEGRRGWGLKLMKTLMDEVKLEQVDDGTRISMVKYLK